MNARFWIWHNDGVVKLTLRPGERLSVCEGGRAEEGYDWTHTTYALRDNILEREWWREARDCDGRIAEHRKLECHVMRVRLHCNEAPGGVAYPEWQAVCQSQRDHAAEAMNY